MANGGRDLIKGLNDLADQLDEVAKGAGTTPQQEWLDMVRQDPSPAPPYALPPYVFVTTGFDIIDKQFDANVKADYLNRSPWGFLVHEVLRPIHRNTPVEQLAFVGPDRGMNAARLARKAVDVRIALEEQVDFPNNLDRKQKARVKFLDPTGEKTARARERQAGNIAAQERAAEAHVIAFERIRKEVVALFTAENTLDEIAASDSDLFTFLYGAMTERAEASDEIFTHADLKDLWSFILDEVTKLSTQLIGGKIKATPPDKRGPIKSLWADLLDKVRSAGHKVIDQPKRFDDDEPGPAKKAWDAFIESIADANRRLSHSIIDQPTFMSKYDLEKALRGEKFSGDELAAFRKVMDIFNRLEIPEGLEREAKGRELYKRQVQKYFKEQITGFRKRVSAPGGAFRVNEIALEIAQEVLKYDRETLALARSHGTHIGTAIARLAGERTKKFEAVLESAFDKVIGKKGARFEDLTPAQRSAVSLEVIKQTQSAIGPSKAATVLKNLSRVQKGLYVLTVSAAVIEVVRAKNPAREFVKQGAQLSVDAACGAMAAFVAEFLLIVAIGTELAGPLVLIPLGLGLIAAALCDWFSSDEVENIFGQNGSLWEVPG